MNRRDNAPLGIPAVPRPSRRVVAFILLEVMVAVVILGIAAAVSMRSVMLSMHATRELEISMRASLLAQAMMESWDLAPPVEGKTDGSFGEDPNYGKEYAFYFYKMEVEEKKVEYDDVSEEGTKREFVPLKKVHLEIIYDDQKNRQYRPLDIYTSVLGLDPVSPQSRQANQLF